MRCFLLTALIAGLAGLPALAADSIFTVRVGEQDTCKVTGVTTVQSQKDGALVRFDLEDPASATRELL